MLLAPQVRVAGMSGMIASNGTSQMPGMRPGYVREKTDSKVSRCLSPLPLGARPAGFEVVEYLWFDHLRFA